MTKLKTVKNVMSLSAFYFKRAVTINKNRDRREEVKTKQTGRCKRLNGFSLFYPYPGKIKGLFFQ